MAMRNAGLEESAVLDLIRRLDERLQVHADELDFRNSGPYVERAQTKYALGFPVVQVIDDLWLASRCLHGRADLHLLKHGVEKLRVRRIEPIELAVLGGQTNVMLSIAEQFAFPIMSVLAHTAGQETRNEAAHCSTFFSTERIEGLRDLVGLAAAAYSAALGALVRGADDEVKLSLDLVRDAAQALGVTGGPDDPPPLVRYLNLARALRALLEREPTNVVAAVNALVKGHLATLERAAAGAPERWARPERAASYMDTSSATIVALAVLKGMTLDQEKFSEAAAPYAEILAEMTAVDRSDTEEAERAAAQEKYEKAVDNLADAGLVERRTMGEPQGPVAGPAVEVPTETTDAGSAE